MQDGSSAWLGFDDFYPPEPLQQPPQKPQMSFDEAIERIEGAKLSLGMESRDGLELSSLQQQILIGDYYSLDESTIERFASLLEKEQHKAWKRKRGMKTHIAVRKYVRLAQELLAFEELQVSVNEFLVPELRDDDHAELDAFFNQANFGDNKSLNPKYFPIVNNDTWEIWATKSGMRQSDARDLASQKSRDLADKYEIQVDALSNIKPSSQKGEFVHRHYHYYLPSQNEYETIP